MQKAIGLLETQGLVALGHGTDAMLTAAHVEFRGWKKIGSALCTSVVTGDVAAVRAAVDAGASAARAIGGKVISVHVIPRPHEEIDSVLP